MSVAVLRSPAEAAQSQADRLAAARRALDRAETAAGVRVRLSGPTAAGPTAAGPAGPPRLALAGGPGVSATSPGGTPPAGPPATLAGPVTVQPAAAMDDRLLPVPAALLPLFPGAGLRRGSVIQVAGSTSLLLALAAAAGTDGWSALAALPDVGLQAAAEAGLDLARVVVVPRPGPDAPAVLGALVDGFDVLVVGDCRALSDRDRRLLASRLHSRESVLLTTRPWPGSDLLLTADHEACSGLGHGWGVLQGQEMTVRARGRGALGAGRTVRVRVGAGGLEPASHAAPSHATPSHAAPERQAV